MLKYVLLASAMTISMPALAQSKPSDTPTAPTTQIAPAQTAPQTVPASATPANTAQPQSVTPADPMATASPAAQDAQAVAQSAPANPTTQPISGAAQIAQVVNTEFPSYDKDKSGTLNEAEFGAWMVALKEKSDPSTKPDSPTTKAWVDQAFASADKDKNKVLTKSELTGFLSQGA